MAPPGTEVRGFRVEIQRRKRGSVLAQQGGAGGVLGKVGNRSESHSRGPPTSAVFALVGVVEGRHSSHTPSKAPEYLRQLTRRPEGRLYPNSELFRVSPVQRRSVEAVIAMRSGPQK